MFQEPEYALKQQNPARYLGYRVFSRWVASDQTYFIVRKFPTLNVRVALVLQDRIVQLEDELNKLDQDWSNEYFQYEDPKRPDADPNLIHNGTFREDESTHRVELIDKIADALERYNRFVNSYAQLARQPPARKDDIDNVAAWFENHIGAIAIPERDYITHLEELIAVQPKDRSWFRGILEMTRFLKMPWMRHFFTRIPLDNKIIYDGRGYWQNDRNVEKFSSWVIAVVGLGMLVGPIWILAFVADSAKRLGVITGFIALFFILVAVATTAKVSEALASAAAYSAVLMVFMQIGAIKAH
ncbi:hypothetical protein BU16DRAFT_451984 [Lophium mytilinum]|uniref:DUF6594 domain-containing protein n=1 Tax=Lophium mytilinum TaxID=390894 RepID=A0A6A6R9K7_9PEZI|nr:hypothetical protein BU16DRAFT_451984 [Lophium mytilinum]